MPFGTLFSGDLYCMPSSFGDRHALQAWGTCNSSTEQYSIGQPKSVPQVRIGGVKGKEQGRSGKRAHRVLESIRSHLLTLSSVSVAGITKADQEGAQERDVGQWMGVQPAA